MLIAAMVAVAVLVAGATFFYVNRNNAAGAGEIFLEPADEPGQNPFTTSIKVDSVSITTTSLGARTGTVKGQSTTTTSKSGSGGSGSTSTTGASTTTGAPTTAAGGTQVASTSGSAPGLYGGTQNVGRCDPAQLVSFLQANPDKATAWTQALNGDPTLQWSGGTQVSTAQIPEYVKELTPLTLTADTRVTNYGFVNGQPTPRQAVLQAGTAVLVDKFGVPRTKCNCGNPLTKPVPVPTTPTYQGTPWQGWNPQNVLVVQPAPAPIKTFTAVNLSGSGYIDRPAGTTGGGDKVSAFTEGSGGPPVSTGGGGLGGGSSTSTERTTTTRAPATSTRPSTTLNKTDYCQIARDAIARFADVDIKDFNLDELIDVFRQLADSSPEDEVRDDWNLLAAEYPKWFEVTDLSNVPPELIAASDRVGKHLETYCGIQD